MAGGRTRLPTWLTTTRRSVRSIDNDHASVADNCKNVSASGAGTPSDGQKDCGRGQGSDLDGAKNRAPATVKVLLNRKPERTIEREL